MGGGMPFHLEKGVLGLRMDYLTRSPAVRQHVLGRLQAGEDPYQVVRSINVLNVGTIDAIGDTQAVFMSKLKALLQAEPNPPSSAHERRASGAYWNDQNILLNANKDNTGNRNSFFNYWTQKMSPALVDQTRQALIMALTSLTGQRTRIDYWWDCSLPDGTPPMVVTSLDSPGVARVLFVTDHEPVEDPLTPMRGAADPAPEPALLAD